MLDRSGHLATGETDHAVQFYGSEAQLSASVASYLGEGLAAGGSAVVVATPAHRLSFEAGLAGNGVDVGAAVAAGQLLTVDAARMLHGFMTDGLLDRTRFRAAADELTGRAASAGRPVRIYAEMVVLLWEAGQVALALELEALWNEQAARSPFSLLCAYPSWLWPADADPSGLHEVCGLHTGIVGPAVAGPGGPAASRDEALAARGFSQARESPRVARHFVLDILGSQVDKAVAADAALVTTELAANAVRHARSAFTLTVTRTAAGIRISVRDHSPLDDCGPLVLRDGHGLDLVAKIADSWAVEPLPDGKIIWAELPA